MIGASLLEPGTLLPQPAAIVAFVRSDRVGEHERKPESGVEAELGGFRATAGSRVRTGAGSR